MTEQPASASVISPTDFKPTPAKSPRGRSFVSWIQIVLGTLAVIIGFGLWFLFTAKAVKLELNVADAEISITGGLVLQTGVRYLMRPGQYTVIGSADGYYDLNEQIEVSNDSNDPVFQIDFIRLPGIVEVTSEPSNVEVTIDGQTLGVTPLRTEIPAGTTTLSFNSPRYIDIDQVVEIEGMQQEQSVYVELDPDWGDVTIPTQPPGATFFIDGVNSGFITPGPAEILSGERVIMLKKPGFASWTDILLVKAGDVINLAEVILPPSDGVLEITTSPSQASVTVDGNFQGITPLTVEVEPNRAHQVEVLLSGYHSRKQQISVGSGEVKSMNFPLERVTGELIVNTNPENAEIRVNGDIRGTSNTTLTLHAVTHFIEIDKEGFVGFEKEVTIQPGFTQQLNVQLLTPEEYVEVILKQVNATATGKEIVLMTPNPIRMGASRREAGRRANEVYRTARLNRRFYISVEEVTNAEFKEFAPGHDSGEYQGYDLNEDDQPVVNISWDEAALYCNYLSEKEGLEPFYEFEGAFVSDFNPKSVGYRLPTEAEWTWVARHVSDNEELLHFPWGATLPPEDRHGNYADKTAQHIVGRIIYGYNDSFPVSAPVGSFPANTKGVYDMGGNVAEWTHDFYHVPTENTEVPLLGLTEGEYHVIRGSSYLHGTITDLRFSFRDYGKDGRYDVGFRIARYAQRD
ncbi:MAG: PEGA domain-containing protein [Gammaproteobacteria bacterium]|nr:PEGA domain-containing protein [Gammaproteobacteria bacterium]